MDQLQQQCESEMMTHWAGVNCLYCDPQYLENTFTTVPPNPGKAKININVCVQFMRKCYPYIQLRVQIGGFVNIINTLQILQ